MNKNYDLAVGAKRLEKVTPSLTVRSLTVLPFSVPRESR